MDRPTSGQVEWALRVVSEDGGGGTFNSCDGVHRVLADEVKALREELARALECAPQYSTEAVDALLALYDRVDDSLETEAFYAAMTAVRASRKPKL